MPWENAGSKFDETNANSNRHYSSPNHETDYFNTPGLSAWQLPYSALENSEILPRRLLA